MKAYRSRTSGRITLEPAVDASGDESEEIDLSGQGTVYSHTTLHAAAEIFEKDLPFQIAIVQLDGGPRLTARIEGDRVEIGDPVHLIRQTDGVSYFSK
jgi:uncharacterized OB-fold protein